MSEEHVSVSLGTRLDAKRLTLRAPRAVDITELRSVLSRNSDYLRPWSPAPPPGTNPLGVTELGRAIAKQRRDWKAGSAFVFVVSSRAPGEPIIGRIALTSIARGPWQTAQLGYWLDAANAGRGLMSEGVELALGFAFDRLGLHRIQAAVMPHNLASRRILAKRGFREEGYAPGYLRIGGVWEDHVLYGLRAEEWRPSLERLSRRTEATERGQLAT
jgi:ribosomal-protein-alanine N-acetyltransferase